MGDYRLPARLRCWHPTLRSRLGPLQPEAYLHSGARGVRNRLVVLRPGPEPLVPGLRTHLAGRGRRGGARFSERGGRQDAAARAPRDGSWFDLLQRRGRSRGRPGCGRRGGFHAGLALSLLRDAAAHATPDTLSPPRTAAHRSFDLPGGILLGLAAGLFLFGITQGQVAGFASFTSWGCFVSAALAAAGFVWRITTATHPFVSPSLFRNPGFVAATMVGFFSMLANVSSLVFVSLLISTVNELSSGAAALALTPGAVALAILAPFAGRLSDRIGFRVPVFAGLSAMLLSVLFLSTFGAGASPIVVAAGMLGLGTGFAFVNSPATNAAAATLGRKEAGVGLGIYQALFFLGGGTGPAVIGAFLAARREAAAEALNPLYMLDAASFSDAFLVIGAALLLAFVASLKLRRDNGQPETGSPATVPVEKVKS